jgi:hypothetical protein
MEWYEDPWIETASEMAEEFFQNHRENMPEDPHEVWDENEVGYFMFSFLLWNAQTKFGLKQGEDFVKRAEQYRRNIQVSYEDSKKGWVDDSIIEHPDYSDYLSREQEYVPTLMKSSASPLKSLTGSIMQPVCKLFLDKACKRFVFSERDFVKTISPWLMDKHIEFEKNLSLI